MGLRDELGVRDLVIYPLLSPEARSLAAVGITVVRRVFLLDETFDLLVCSSAAVGFTITSAGSFCSN